MPACPPCRVVVAGAPGYQLPAIQTDADTFLGLASLARFSLRQEDPWTAWHRTTDALALWRGRPLVDAGSRASLSALIAIYARLLDRIVHSNYDVLSRRIRVSTPEKLWLLVRSGMTAPSLLLSIAILLVATPLWQLAA